MIDASWITDERAGFTREGILRGLVATRDNGAATP
jgi:hypothetical protein